MGYLFVEANYTGESEGLHLIFTQKWRIIFGVETVLICFNQETPQELLRSM